MDVSLVSFLSLVFLTLSADRVVGQMIVASENPLPVGSNVTLSLVDGTVTVGTWLQDSNPILLIFPPNGHFIYSSWKQRVTFTNSSDGLTIRSLQLSDSATYKLSSADPNFNAELLLSVQEPISNVMLQAKATNLVEYNDTAVLNCSVSRGSSLSYVWINGSSVVTQSGGVQLLDEGSILTIEQVTRYDHGPFRCNVSNGISKGFSQLVYLNISYGPSDPTLTIVPMRVAYKTGSNLTLHCSAASSPPATIQWLLNGKYLGQFGPQLQLENARDNQTGHYECLLHNAVTNRFSGITSMIRVVEPVSAVNVTRVGGPAILNESFTLRCDVTGPVDAIHWWRDDQVIHPNNHTLLHNETLTLNRVQHSDSGDYKCQAVNAVSNKTSSPYYVIVNYGPETPVIQGPSMGLTGHHVTFNCSSSSEPPSHFRWFFNSSPVANTSQYVIGPLSLHMSGKYVCVAHNNVTGRNSSAYKMLTVYAPVNMSVIKSVEAHAIQNHTFTLTCEASGTVESIHWMKNRMSLYADGRRNLSMANATLTFDPVLLSDNGYYECDASNPLSSSTSNNFTLHVSYGPEKATITGPDIVMAGHSAVLNCLASSYPPSYFEWFFDGSPVANLSEYETPPLTTNMSGKYICVAYNNVTGQNSTAYKMLTVVDPITKVHIVAPLTPAIQGSPYQLMCNVTGPDDHVYWMKDGGMVHEDNTTSFSMGNKTVNFSPVEKSNSGYYQCMASNYVNNKTSPSYSLHVNFGPGKPVIIGPAVGEKGKDVAFNCSAQSFPPSHFYWFFNGSRVANTSVYQIGPLSFNMSGEYTCLAHNDVTQKNTTGSITLTVIEGIKSVRVIEDTIPIDSRNLTLTCEVAGAYDSIYWMKDNKKLDMNSSNDTSHMSYYIGKDSLHFSPLTIYNDGTYRCVAINIGGSHESPDFVLLVNYGPLSVNITGPDSVEIGSVLTVSLRCSADSQPKSRYQWFFNFQSAVMETDSVMTIWATEANIGNYTCEATNPVTNITMSKTKEFIITSRASLPLREPGSGLALLALSALCSVVLSDWLH